MLGCDVFRQISVSSPSTFAISTFLLNPIKNRFMPDAASVTLCFLSCSSLSISVYRTIGPAISCGNSDTYVPNENKLHDTLIVKGTPFAMLYGENGIVNSAHHQAVRKPGKGFRITQVWLSGKLNKDEREEWIRKIENEESLEVECKRTCIIEGMMHRELPIIAVQWHPELMHRNPIHGTLDQDRIFMYFISLLH